MGICSSYASLWPQAVVAMLAISLASSEAPSCNNGAGDQCYPSSGSPVIPDQTVDIVVLEAQCLSACIANVRCKVAEKEGLYILYARYVHTHLIYSLQISLSYLNIQ